MLASDSERRKIFLAYAIPILAIVAPALGGSAALWAQAVIAFAIGILFVLFPPRRAWRRLAVIFVIFFALALTAYLPARWFGLPEWRIDLERMGAQLPWTLSPQPWLTTESICLLLLGLSWAFYLFVFDWNFALREKAVATFCIGILFLAATMSVAFAIQKRVPFWEEAYGFGFFRNRNETGNVLALGGVMIYALGMQRLQEGRANWWIWILSVCLVLGALIINFSRAGIILFFAGALAWHLWWLSSAKKKRGPALLLSAMIFLGGVLLWNGSELLGRFARETGGFLSLSGNGRLAIYRDSFELFKQSPLFGIGLANFRSVFASQRHFFISTTESIHPESDWFWLAIEMGSVAFILMPAAVALWLRNCFPLQPGSRRALRVAAIICGILFVLHGFLDVPGHRVGSLWPALFLCSIAIHPKIKSQESRIPRNAYRILGGSIIVIAIWWSLSIFELSSPPTARSVNRLLGAVEDANHDGKYARAISLANKGLTIAPLDWKFFYARGLAQAALHGPRTEVVRDFAIARYLLPNWPDLALNEGLVWLSVGEPDLAFSVWEESMRRWPATAAELYKRIYDSIRTNVELRDRWRHLGHIDGQCRLVLLQHSEGLEFEIELERLFSEDPDLQSFSPAELKTLFQSWFKQGDRLRLIEMLKQHPEWQTIAWRELSQSLANLDDYRPAYETAHRFVRQPRLPEIGPNDSADALMWRFRSTGNIDNDGIPLVMAQMKSGELDLANKNLEDFIATGKAPDVVYFLQSEVWAAKGDWRKAWQAIFKYESAIQK